MLTLNIFYSWQGKTDEKDNRYFIKKAIINALDKLQASALPELHNIAFNFQESTMAIAIILVLAVGLVCPIS